MRLNHLWILFLTLAVTTNAWAQSGSNPVAVVNGETITEEQLNQAAARDLETLDMKRMQAEATYNREKSEIMERALNSLMEDKLLTAEAAKRKIEREQLIAEIDSKATPPTEAEMMEFYEQNRARIPISYEQAESQIRDYMLQMKRNSARDEFFASLKKDYSVTSNFQPLRLDIPTAGHPSLGPANAPVTIVEFSDFECPFCGQLYPVMKQIEAKYAENLRVVFRQFPLTTIHPNAQKAAEASLCARDQNKFWEYHDLLFANQRELSVDALKSRAEELKLDTAAFNECLDSGKQAPAVRSDVAEGHKAGVTGTPAVYINGRPYRSEISLEAIGKVIEQEMQTKGAAK